MADVGAAPYGLGGGATGCACTALVSGKAGGAAAARGAGPADMTGGCAITFVARSFGSGCPHEKHTEACPGIASVVMLQAGQRTSIGAPPAEAKG